VGLLCLVLSIVYHGQLDFAGVVAVETLTELLDQEIKGSIEIGELHNVTYGKVVANAVVIRDPAGDEVIRAERVAAWPDWSALWQGEIRVDRIRLRGGTVTLRPYGPEGDQTVSIAETFLPNEPSTTPPNPDPIPIILDGIVLDDVTVRGDVPGYEGLRVEDIRMQARVDIGTDAIIRVYDGRGTMTGPYEGEIQLDRIVGRVHTDMYEEGIEAWTRAHVGEDRFRVRFRLWMEPPEDDPSVHLDIQATFDPIRMSTLAELEVAPGLDNLRGTFRGNARLHGPVDDLRLRGDLTSEAGRVHVRGHLPSDGPLTFEGWTQDRLRVGELVPAAPPMSLEARATVTIELPGDDAPEDAFPEILLRAESGPFRIGDFSIPAATTEAQIFEESLRIDSVEAAPAGGTLEAEGTVGFDASLDLHVQANIPQLAEEPNVRRLAPEVRGSLDADVQIRSDAELANLTVDGRASSRGLRYGQSFAADSVTVRGHYGGEPPAPELRATGGATGLRLGELQLGQADLEVRGGPSGYTLEVRTSDARSGTRVSIDARAVSREDRLTIDTTQLMLDLGDGQPWRGSAGVTLNHGRSVELRPVQLSRGDESVRAEGVYRFNGPDAIDVTAEQLDLAQLRPFAPDALEGLAGVLDAELAVRGDLDTRPQGTLRASVRDGAYRGIDGVEVRAELALEDETLQTDLRVDMGDHGSASARGSVGLTAAVLRDPSRILEDADLSGLQIRTADLDLAPFIALAGSDVAIAGRVTTDVTLGGTPGHPEITESILVLDRVILPGWDPLRLKARLAYGDDRIRAQEVWVADAGGELLTANADLPLSLSDPPTDLRSFWRSLHQTSWSADARVPQRLLDGLPRPVGEGLPPGIRVTGQVRAYGDTQGPHATFSALARVLEVEQTAQCDTDTEPYVTLEGRLDGSVATATVLGYTGGEASVLEGSLSATLPLDDWIAEGDVPSFPTTEVELRLDGAEMASIPYACVYGSGPIYGTVRAQGVLTDDPHIGAVINLPRLQVWERLGERDEASRLTQPFRVHVRAGSAPEGGALTACLILGLTGEEATPGDECRHVDAAAAGEMISRLRVPVEFAAGRPLPVLTEGAAISSWTDFSAVRVAPVMSFVPGVVGGDALIDGELSVEGPIDSLRAVGELELSRGHVQIEGLGQRLSGIRGRIELHGDEVVIPSNAPLRAADSGGQALVQGRIGLDGVIPDDVDLSLTVSSFPIRREGMVLAFLSGAATIGGQIGEDETRTTITTREFQVQLPEQTAASLQPLEPHPEVLVVGTERAVGGAAADAYRFVIDIDASEPFWVRRNDFAVEVSARISATYADPELRLDGWARIERGSYEIFGKTFNLTEGTITFDPATSDLDPSVYIVAVYNVQGTSDTVTVEVTGTLTDPHIEFSSTATSDQAEIIALLVSGSRRQGGTASQAVEEQTASFLAGLTAGILTLGLRQELGDVIPVLAIESQGLGGTRVRAGFSADELIPDFLRGIIVGAYVEGFVTAAAEDTNAGGGSAGGGGVGGGVSVEFTFPDDLLLRGTYVPVDNGSLDLVYEP